MRRVRKKSKAAVKIRKNPKPLEKNEIDQVAIRQKKLFSILTVTLWVYGEWILASSRKKIINGQLLKCVGLYKR